MNDWRMPEAFYDSDNSKKRFTAVCHHSFLGNRVGGVAPVVLFETLWLVLIRSPYDMLK
jgi:hypothetical protein